MNHLIIYTHPSAVSLNTTIKNHLADMLKGKYDVQIRALHQLNFNPVLLEQDLFGQKTGVLAEDVTPELCVIC